MEIKANLIDFVPQRNIGGSLLTFKAENVPFNEIPMLMPKDLRLTIDVWREKRSLDANGLLWKCIGIISNSLGADKWDIYLQMLKRYGKYTYIVVKPNVVEATMKQWRESEVVGDIEINGQKGVQMLCYFGSSTYDTKEFSVLLNGVISEMKEMGLSLPPSEDMRRLLEEWKA